MSFGQAEESWERERAYNLSLVEPVIPR
jgi:hypothetical protein